MSRSYQVPHGWKDCTIDDHIRFEGGTQPPRSTFIFEERPGYVRLVQTRDFKSDRYKTFIPITANHKTFTEADVMIGRYGPPVFQIYRGLSGAYNVALIKATPKSEELRGHYLYYSLKQDRLFSLIDSLSRRSSGQTGVDMDALKSFPLPLPPLAEQDRIIEILRAWDEAIEKLEALRTTKRDWLTGLSQMLLGRGGVFPDRWELRSLSAISTRIRRQNGGHDHPVMTISAKSGFLMQSDKFSRDMAGRSVDRYILLQEGEFAYNKGNSLTAPYGCVFPLDRPTALVPFVYFCFALKSGLSREFYTHLFAAGALNHQLSRLINSGVRNDGLLNLDPDDFFGCKVPVPPAEEQATIASALTAAKKEIELLSSEIDALDRQKRGLAQKLLTGKWRVKVEDSEEEAA